MLNSLIYNIKEAIKSIIRNRSMSLASIASVTISLFVFGIILCIVLNLNNITAKTQEQFNSINVYLSDDLSDEDKAKVSDQLKQINYIDEVLFESKEKALENLKERWGDKAYLLDGINNPLQDSYIVKISSSEHSDEIISNINKINGSSGIPGCLPQH